MTTVVDFPHNEPPAQPRIVRPATSRLLVDALTDRVERERIVRRIVDISRELADRQSRAEFWTEIQENYRERCRAEGATTPQLARAMELLHGDIAAENDRRTAMAKELAGFDPLPWSFVPEVPAGTAVVLSFPGEGPVDQFEAGIPKLDLD